MVNLSKFLYPAEEDYLENCRELLDLTVLKRYRHFLKSTQPENLTVHHVMQNMFAKDYPSPPRASTA